MDSLVPPVAFCYEKMSKRVGQIHLGMGGKWETMHGSIIGVIDEKDGRENVRGWLRKMKQKNLFL